MLESHERECGLGAGEKSADLGYALDIDEKRAAAGYTLSQSTTTTTTTAPTPTPPPPYPSPSSDDTPPPPPPPDHPHIPSGVYLRGSFFLFNSFLRILCVFLGCCFLRFAAMMDGCPYFLNSGSGHTLLYVIRIHLMLTCCAIGCLSRSIMHASLSVCPLYVLSVLWICCPEDTAGHLVSMPVHVCLLACFFYFGVGLCAIPVLCVHQES